MHWFSPFNLKCGATLSLHLHSPYDICVFRKRQFQPLVILQSLHILWKHVIVDKLLTVITVYCNIANCDIRKINDVYV